MKFISDGEHYSLLIENGILKAQRRIWIATANVKDVHIPRGNRGSSPLLGHLERLQRNGVCIRLLHGARPSALFLNTLHLHSELHSGEGFEMQQCPRVHSKIIIVDNRFAYIGSANLTGAGMGARSEKRRNFETGFITEEPEKIAEIEEYFDRIWMGEYCLGCGRRNLCPLPFV